MGLSTRVQILVVVYEFGPLPVWEISRRLWPGWIVEGSGVNRPNPAALQSIERSLASSRRYLIVEHGEPGWRLTPAGVQVLRMELEQAGVRQRTIDRFLSGTIGFRRLLPEAQDIAVRGSPATQGKTDAAAVLAALGRRGAAIDLSKPPLPATGTEKGQK